MPLIKQLAHVCITTKDLDATVRFYHDLLGLEVAYRYMRGDKVIGCYFHAGGHTFIECFSGKKGEAAQGDIKHFCLQTEDIDALETHLREAGAELGSRRLGYDQSHQLWCKDPNGIDVEFQQYTPDSCQFSGKDCTMDW